jgi:nitrogenase subunit NifH
VNQLREGGDNGKPIAAIAPQSEVGQVFADLAKKIAEMKPKKIFSQALKVT